VGVKVISVLSDRDRELKRGCISVLSDRDRELKRGCKGNFGIE
jgi:hypothetical protein